MLVLLHTSSRTPFSPLSPTPLLSKWDGWILEWDSGSLETFPSQPGPGPAGVRREG